MHEMGIASSVLEAVAKESHRQAGCRPTRVGLRIGEFASVDPDSLRFAFDVLAGEIALEIDFRAGTDELSIAFIEFEDEAVKEATV